MNLEQNVQKNHHCYRENPHFDPRALPEIDVSPPKPSTESEYFKDLLRRLLANDSKKALIEKTLFRFFSEGLFGSEYIQQFFMELYRHNCRRNTIPWESKNIFWGDRESIFLTLRFKDRSQLFGILILRAIRFTDLRGLLLKKFQSYYFNRWTTASPELIFFLFRNGKILWFWHSLLRILFLTSKTWL